MPLVWTLLLLLACVADAAERQTLKTIHVPAAVSHLAPIRNLPGDQRLKLAIGLPLRNQTELDELLRQLYDPSNPNYRQWLTPEQFTGRFGPTEQDYQALQDFAAANRLTITFTHPNRVVLDVEGRVQDIERAFNTTLHVYRHPAEDREFYAPDLEPSLDLAVPILDISGLDNFSLPKPHHKQKVLPQGSTIRPNAGSGPSGSYRGNDFRAAYVPGNALTGAGQSVGLLQFDGYYASDIATYESQAGLPNVTLVNVPVDGGVSTPGSGNSEVCLDIEMVISIAPAISKIYVYEAPNPSPWVDLLSRMANDNLAKQLSCSWGGGGVNASAEQIFKQMGTQGQSFFNASGDSDAFTSTIPFPSDSTNITQVGGTTLSTTGPGGSYVSETAWNWGLVQGSYTGTSGGVSTYYNIPDYQLGISMGANQGSTTKRNVPDVALTADDLYVVYNNGSTAVFGGTSGAAPLWAGLTALINQQATANGVPVVGFLNPAVYTIGKGGNYSSCFHDITTGNNFSSSSPTKYSAVAGYDLCTGWGTPIGNGLINALAGPPAPSVVSNSFTLTAESCANTAVDPGESVTMTFGLKNIGSVNTTNVVATLQASGGVTSPSGSQSYGALTAGGAAVNRSFTFVAGGTCGGTVTATLQLQDGAANLGTVPFTVKLGQVVPGISFTQNFDGVSAPALPSGWATTVVSGAQTDWTTTTAAADSSPNAAFGADSASAGVNALVSPVIPIASATPQLTFRHNFNLEMHTHGHTTSYYDGGVLEIKIGSGSFTDILSAGGSFAAGGYNCTLTSGGGNAYGGSQAWGGSSGGWITTTVNLPPAATGQNVQLRWVSTTDNSNVYTAVGWYVDSISLQDGVYACCTSATNTPPAIATQPTNQTVVAGNNVTFNAAATGSAPLTYQWYFNGTTPVGTNGPVLGLSNVQSSQAGPYKLVVTNAAGSVTSVTASLTVLVPPAFTLQPSNQTTIVSNNVTFNAAVTGSAPLTYQWYFNGTTPVGTNGPTLGLSNVQSAQAGPYKLVVTNAAGSVTSLTASLTVLVPPAFTLQPSNQTAIVSNNVTFNAALTGSVPLTYQWYLNGTTPIGTNGPTLGLPNVQSAQAGPYRLVVTNAAGSVTSVTASLTVLVPPALTLQPSNQTTIVSNNVTFNAAATGSAPLTYQWYFNGTTPVGTNGPTLGLPNVQSAQAGSYKVVVTNAAGSVTSVTATLTVLVPPAFTLQPSNQTTIVSNNVTLSAAATGSAPLTYQWYFNGTTPVGTNGSTLGLSNVQSSQAGPYQLIVTNAAGSATSAIANLTVLVPPSFTLQPSNHTVLPGNSVSFDISATGSAPLTYQWYFNGTTPMGTNGPTLALNNVQPVDAGGYNVIVTNSAGSATSAVAMLILLTHPTLLSPQIITNGDFTFVLSGDTGQNYVIEATTNWQDWEQLGSLSNATGQTSFTHTNASSSPFRVYRARLMP